MATTMKFEDHLSAIAAGAGALADDADACRPGTLVPTCPGWTVADLLAHQGMVHRWAAGIAATGWKDDPSHIEEEAEATVPPNPEDRPAWLRFGAKQLIEVLAGAPEDLQTLVFLRDAASPRQFWARRQAHETTIHRVDALAARLGRIPTAGQVGIPTQLAVDGIDELVCGFVPRSRSRLRSAEPFVLTILPTDADAAWTVTVSPDPPVSRLGGAKNADSELSGTTAALYLGVWNRGDEIADNGPEDGLGLWRDKVRISWS